MRLARHSYIWGKPNYHFKFFSFKSVLSCTFQKYPRIGKLVSGYCNGETVKKAQTFTSDDINTFLKMDPQNQDKYMFVRKAVCICAVASGVRGSDLRPLMQSSVKEVKNGLRLTFVPCKQRGHVEEQK